MTHLTIALANYCSSKLRKSTACLEINHTGAFNRLSAFTSEKTPYSKLKADPVISIYNVRLNSGLKIKEFKEMTEEWLDFIVACRSGKDHTYDIVIGAMADDQIYNYVSDYIGGVITREQFWALARFKYPTHQIVFCTEEALKCLEYRDCEVF